MIKRLILMIQFLTRIPLSINLNVTEEDFSKGVIFFPVVGLIIGGILFGINFILTPYFNVLSKAVLLTIACVFITGGLHLDGLADTFDGVYSNRSKERILEIMKDSRVGSNGALVLIIILLLKASLLTNMSDGMIGGVLLVMPVVARASVVYVCRFSKYARETGMGNFFIGKVNNVQLIFALGFTSIVIYLINIMFFIPLVGVLIFATWFKWSISKKIDGMTGDTIGAVTELSEVVFLIISIFTFMS